MSEINEIYPVWGVYVVYALFGLMGGSFANALAARIPEGETLLTRSHCVKCGHSIAWYDNIPVLSWIALRGRCRMCKEPISFQYPAVEIITAGLWVAITAATGALLIPEPFTAGLYILSVIGVALSVIDFRTLTLPNKLVFSFTGVSVFTIVIQVIFELLNLVPSNESTLGSLLTALIAMLIFGGLYFAIFMFSGGKWMGYGDVKLVPSLGLMSGYLGWETALLALILPYIISSVPIMILMGLGKMKKGKQVPFGPFLLMGFAASVLFSNELVSFYTSITGLN